MPAAVAMIKHTTVSGSGTVVPRTKSVVSSNVPTMIPHFIGSLTVVIKLRGTLTETDVVP